MNTGNDHLLIHDGVERTYKLHKPKELKKGAPMLFLLHGMNSSSDWSYRAGFNELAEKHGFLAVYPQSHRKLIQFGKPGGDAVTWLGEKAESCEEGERFQANGMEILCRDGQLTSTMPRWNDDNADELFDGQSDVEFLSALAVALQEEHHVNPEKTYVAGFSNGGYMSYTLMCQAGNVFRAAGIVGGFIDADVLRHCELNTPKPIIHIHGAEDSIEGQVDKNSGEKQPGVQEIVEHFANLNPSVTVEQQQVTDNTRLTIYRSDSGADVHFYRIENHGHVWPGGDMGGKKLKDESGLNASEVIWDFFSSL